MTITAEAILNPQFQANLDAALTDYFSLHTERAAVFDSSYQRLWDALSSVSKGGKRIRPHLVNEAYTALGGTDIVSSVGVGVAFELLHTAFVVHDDIIDGDVVRRGNLNVTGQFLTLAEEEGLDYETALHWAESSALIGGDLLLTHAQRMIATLTCEASVRDAILDLYEEAVFITAAGEQADVSLSSQPQSALTLERVIQMEEHKTAAYSFGAPLQAGVVLAGADAGLSEVMGEYGRLLGTAFQLRDDYLGLFGEESLTGKSVLSDLREGKSTPIMIFARGTDAWPLIEELRSRTDIEGTVHKQILNALIDSGARTFLEDLEQEYSDRASEMLADPLVPALLADRLTVMSELLAGRRS